MKLKPRGKFQGHSKNSNSNSISKKKLGKNEKYFKELEDGPSSEIPSPLKKLGQHYLVDKAVIEKICHLQDKNFDGILEIGPGPGVLTKTLASFNIPFFVIEKDNRFSPNLKNYLSSEHILIEDALEIDWKTHPLASVASFRTGKSLLISNLPYNVSVPLYLSFFPLTQFSHLTLMFQKEVANKILGDDKKNNASSLSILTQCYFTIGESFEVPPSAFSPPPEVDSRVISLIRKIETDVPLEQFSKLESFLRKIFAFRRKQLKKILLSNYPRTQIDEIFSKLQLSVTIRAEALSYKEVMDLYEAFTLKKE